MRRVLIGTLGYHFLRDYSVGPKLLPELRALDWPPGVKVDELNWGPIAIVYQFETLAVPYERVVILTATARGRPAGTLTLFRWAGTLPPKEEIQDRVSEAVTGVISLDNLLIIGEYFKIWPQEVIIVDIEPGPEEAGDTFTPPVEALLPTIKQMVRRVALADLAALPLLQPLKGEQLGCGRPPDRATLGAVAGVPTAPHRARPPVLSEVEGETDLSEVAENGNHG